MCIINKFFTSHKYIILLLNTSVKLSYPHLFWDIQANTFILYHEVHIYLGMVPKISQKAKAPAKWLKNLSCDLLIKLDFANNSFITHFFNLFISYHITYHITNVVKIR